VQAVCLSATQRRHDIGNFGGYFRAFLDFALSDEYFGDEVRSYLQEIIARQDQGRDEE
jgi:UTP-glucose-1-phosphate uridylyltransferase